MSNGRHTSTPPTQEKDEPQRPTSPDSPQILGELRQYSDSGGSRGSNSAPQISNSMIQPQSMNRAPRTMPRKRKEQPDHLGLWSSNKRHPYSQYSYPGLGSFGLPPSSMNHGLARAANSLYMGAGSGSSPFQLPSLLSDPQLGLPLAPESLMTPSSGSSSAPSSNMPPYLLSSNFPLPYTPPMLPQTRMFAPFPSSVLNRGLSSNSAASTFPSYLSSQSSYQSPNGGSTSHSLPSGEAEAGSSDEDGRDDDDVVEVTGK